MAIAGYEQWAIGYAVMFGLDRESDVKMLMSWQSIFDADGFTERDLQEAKSRIAQNPPRWRTEHLIAIQAAVRGIRLARRKAELEMLEEKAILEVCQHCGNSGWVIVPHPANVVDGSWTPGQGGFFYTCAVACMCFKGSRHVERVNEYNADKPDWKKKPLPMSLASFERRCPNWPAEMIAQDKRRAEQIKAYSTAKEIDKRLGVLKIGKSLKAILEKVKQ